jgi:signal transduction histidine kinase/MFS family permease
MKISILFGFALQQSAQPTSGAIESGLQGLSQLYIGHRHYISLFSALVALMCAVFLLFPREGHRLVGRWVKYVGLAFVTFFLLHSLRYVSLLLGASGSEVAVTITTYLLATLIYLLFLAAGMILLDKGGLFKRVPPRLKYVGLAIATFFLLYALRYLYWLFIGDQGDLDFVVYITIYLLSILNNLFFLAAGKILLNKERPFKRVPLRREWSRLEREKIKLLNAVKELEAAVPRWVWPLVLFTLIAAFQDSPSPWLLWVRLPDSIFSAYCLTVFGYGVMINFNFRRRAYMAALALLVALGYAIFLLIFAANPALAYVAKPEVFANTSAPLATWIKKNVGEPLDRQVKALNERVKQADPTRKEGVKARDFLDSLVFAVALPLKFLLFLPSFILYFLFILAANDFRRVLHETAKKRRDYLSSEGIVGAIGKGLAADLVELFIRMPGKMKIEGKLEELIQPIRWEPNVMQMADTQELPVPLSPEIDPLLVQIMKEDDEEIIHPPRSRREKALMMIPIKFHGGVIGCLKVELQGFGTYNYTALQQVRMMAALVAPTIESHRALAVMNEMGSRFARIPVRFPAIRFRRAIKLIVEDLYDVTAPLAAAIFLESGFTRERFIYTEDENLKAILQKSPPSFKVEEVPSFMKVDGIGRIKTHVDLLNNPRHPGDKYMDPLGNVVFAIRAKCDEFDKPTLATYYLNRLTIASLTSNALLDVARDHYGLALKNLGLRLADEKLTRETWFREIKRASKKVGLLWAVATQPDGGEMSGDEVGMEIVRDLSDEERQTLGEKVLGSVVINPAKPPTHHVIKLKLVNQEQQDCLQQLWFGVERPGFGHELNFDSPWKIFFDGLGQIAYTSLRRMLDREETRKLELDNAQTQDTMTIAVTTGILMHELVNLIKDQVFAVAGLREAADHDEITLDENSERLLVGMHESARNMLQFTTAFKNVTKMEERRPCFLKEAAEEARRLFQSSLEHRRIDVEINVAGDVQADVPFHVPAFALTNLISNARDAIGSNGKITIDTDKADGYVLCHVTDDGPGIPPEIRQQLFDLGFSKTDGHNGWGLFLIARALRANHGGIELTHSRPESDFTRFTIRLPSPPPT